MINRKDKEVRGGNQLSLDMTQNSWAFLKFLGHLATLHVRIELYANLQNIFGKYFFWHRGTDMDQ